MGTEIEKSALNVACKVEPRYFYDYDVQSNVLAILMVMMFFLVYKPPIFCVCGFGFFCG